MMNTSSGSGGGLIKLSGNLEDPRNAKASDFPAVGPLGPAGEASEQNQLIKQTQNQEGPRHTQDDGENTPSVWGKADGFAVQKNKGEGAGQSTIKCDWSVDFETGQTVPNAALDNKY
jgi:hypothetical protein